MSAPSPASAPAPRPPWWPEGEPWPPRGKGPPGAPRAFFRKIGCLLGALFGLMFAAGALISTVVPDGPDRHRGDDGSPFGPLGFLLIILLIVFIARTVRRTAAPIGDVMAAADRVAAGDYGARVEPSGSREVRRLAESFNEMTARLRANEELRRNLLADVAHELRTPLSVIRGTVEGMVDGVYPRDDAHLAPIVEETKRMDRLLDDLRTLSLTEAGALRLHREPTDVADLIGDALAAAAPRAAASGVNLGTDLAPLPELNVDPVRLREVLDNLLANAVRYTPPGGSVHVSVAADGRLATVAVADTGRGIPPADLPHLFDRFWKSADSGGSGLGLTIARRLVEAHGGTMSAESRPGAGTTIRFTLPLDGGGLPAAVADGRFARGGRTAAADERLRERHRLLE